MVFVFGSNLAGRHGKGAAKDAVKLHGAIYGQASGRQGNSYAIPTKDAYLNPLPLDKIERYVEEFLIYADGHLDEEFQVTRIGCGLAGYTDDQIAPMFDAAPPNCHLPEGW